MRTTELKQCIVEKKIVIPNDRNPRYAAHLLRLCFSSSIGAIQRCLCFSTKSSEDRRIWRALQKGSVVTLKKVSINRPKQLEKLSLLENELNDLHFDFGTTRQKVDFNIEGRQTPQGVVSTRKWAEKQISLDKMFAISYEGIAIRENLFKAEDLDDSLKTLADLVISSLIQNRFENVLYYKTLMSFLQIQGLSCDIDNLPAIEDNDKSEVSESSSSEEEAGKDTFFRSPPKSPNLKQLLTSTSNRRSSPMDHRRINSLNLSKLSSHNNKSTPSPHKRRRTSSGQQCSSDFIGNEHLGKTPKSHIRLTIQRKGSRLKKRRKFSNSPIQISPDLSSDDDRSKDIITSQKRTFSTTNPPKDISLTPLRGPENKVRKEQSVTPAKTTYKKSMTDIVPERRSIRQSSKSAKATGASSTKPRRSIRNRKKASYFVAEPLPT